MIPILYDTGENTFVTNGLGRLPDCVSCVVTEERNGIYECDFEYPITGKNFNKIKVGRIIAVSHDESGDVQPFDIVSFTRPIEGLVSFHCVHISYRQCYMTASGSGINSLAGAFAMLSQAVPGNPFIYDTDKTSSGYLGAGDGLPHSVRSILGGIEGSILDSYGGEYEWNKWTVILHSARGKDREIAIRYGRNMLDYNEEFSTEGTYSSCVPYWTDGMDNVVGDRVISYGSTITGRGECVPLNLSDKFETQPTKAQLENSAMSYMSSSQTYLPAQTIRVEFIRLQDTEEFSGYKGLMRCGLCDTVMVYFPDYAEGKRFKIVRVEWDVLLERYNSMELGDLSTSLAKALGITQERDNQFPLVRTSETYNNMTVYRYGNVRMVYVNSVDGQTVGQLNASDRPPVVCRSVGTVYNGSSYVTAILGVDTSGNVTIQGQYGGAIAGIQVGFMAPRYITYLV